MGGDTRCLFFVGFVVAAVFFWTAFGVSLVWFGWLVWVFDFFVWAYVVGWVFFGRLWFFFSKAIAQPKNPSVYVYSSSKPTAQPKEPPAH